MNRTLINALVVLTVSFLLTSCGLRSVTVSSDYRSHPRYHYWYYPNAEVYFDYEQKVYYYPENGGWQRSEHLPSRFEADTSHVEVEVDSDKPYTHYEEHRKKYSKPHKKDDRENEHRDDRNDGRSNDQDNR